MKIIEIDGEKYQPMNSGKEMMNFTGRKYAIVRSRDQGVMGGFVDNIEGTTVTLLKARQLWKWSSKFVLPDMAEFGVKEASDCKFSCEMTLECKVFSACAVLYCTPEAEASIRQVEAQDV